MIEGRLFAQAQFFDKHPIACKIGSTKIIQQLATVIDHLEQAPSGMIVMGMDFKVTGQVLNPCRYQGDLDFRRSGISITTLVILDYGRFILRSQCHGFEYVGLSPEYTLEY